MSIDDDVSLSSPGGESMLKLIGVVVAIVILATMY
jgi:hypothetical protein